MPNPPLLSFQQLMAQARQFAVSYENIKGCFVEFSDHAAELSKGEPLPNVVIHKDPGQLHFDAVYLGRRFRFELVFHARLDGNAMGVVLCSEVLPTGLRPVYQFDITENGQTDVKPPGSEEPIGCNSRKPAWYILLNAMHEGLTKHP